MLPCQPSNTPVSADEIPKEGGGSPSRSGCCLSKSVLLIYCGSGVKNLGPLGCSAFPLVLSEAGRSRQVYTGLALRFSFVTLNGRRVPLLSDVCASTCWGRFAVLSQDSAGQGASFCSVLRMCPPSLSPSLSCGLGDVETGTGRERFTG